MIESDARKRNIDNIGVVLSKIHLDVPASKFAFRSRFSKSFTFSSFPFDFFISGYGTIQVIFSALLILCSIAQKKDANNVNNINNNNNNNNNNGQHLNNVKIWRQQ